MKHCRGESLLRIEICNRQPSRCLFSAEPNVSAPQIDCRNSIWASSYDAIFSITALEAGFRRIHPCCAPAVFEDFAHDVEFTLYYVAEKLRKQSADILQWPVLRDGYHRLVESSDLEDDMQFIAAETDHLTNTLNTLREKIVAWKGD